MSSGGASGEVILPNYLIQTHANWLGTGKPPFSATVEADYDAMWATVTAHGTFNVPDEMILSANSNPFTGVSAYDPSDELDDVDNRYEDFEDGVDDVDPGTILTDAIASAIAEIDGGLIDEAFIQASVDAYEDSTNARFLRGKGRDMVGFQAGRAVMTTHYDHAVGDFEVERGYDVGKYEADLRLNMKGQRMELAKYLSGQFISLIELQLTSLQNATTLRLDVAKARIAGEQDRINLDLKLDENEENWRLDRFDTAARIIAAYNGGGPAPKPTTTGERVMQTLLTAASVGISGGQALKSPAAGGALGGITLLTALLTGGLK